MANRFLSNIRINDAYTFPASDGNNGQFIATDGAGNLTFTDPSASSSASIIYRDNFTGDGTTTVFTLQNSLSDEDQTQIYIDGVYQEKSTYSLSTNAITFSTAPINGHSIEVISISGINVGPTTIYQDNFTGNGTTTDFTLAQAIDNEVKTMIYFNGVYQFKDTYTLNSTTISFDTAPANGVDIEVISIASAAAADYNQLVKFYGKATEAISKGDAVMLDGQEGDHFLLSKATQAGISSNHEYFLGLASQDLTTGEFGYVTEFGKINELDTSGYTAGDILWFDAGGSTAGALTTTEPAAPLAKIQVAAVIRSHQNEGVLFVRPTWYHELGELHDVNITSIADKDLLVWNNSNSYWENTKTLGDLTLTGNLTVNGTQTILNTQTVEVEDNILQLNTTQGSPDTATATTSGISIYRGDGVTQASFIFDDADDTWDLTNNLVVDGNATFAGAITGTSVSLTTSGTVLSLDRTGGATALIELKVGGTVEGYLGANSTKSLIVYNELAAEKFSISNTGNATFAGSVGIGTASPSQKLDVVGIIKSSGVSNSLMFSDRNTASNTWEWYSSGNNAGLYKNHNVAGTVMTIDSSGNVGIGTTSPDLGAVAGTRVLTIASPTAERWGILELAGNRTWGGNQVGELKFISTDSTNNGTLVSLTAINDPTSTGTGGSLNFNTRPDGGSLTERMRIDSSGNVMIGKNSQSGNAALTVKSMAGGNTGLILIEGDTTNDGHGLYATTDNKFVITRFTNGSYSDNFVMDSSGQVGIGTSSPTHQMHIHTDNDNTYALRIEGSTNNAAGVWTGIGIAGESANTKSAIIFQDIGVSYARGKLLFCVNNDLNQTSASPSDARMTISNDGNVGIGTTSPATKLHIKNAPNNSVCYVEDTTGYALFQLGNSGGGLYFGIDNSAGTAFNIGSGYSRHIYSTGTNNFHISTNASPRITINGSSGNVGIGTTSPTSKLDVRNDDGVGNGLHLISDFSRAGGADAQLILGYFANGSAVTGPVVYAANGMPLLFSAGSTEKMRITSGGNVGIGTTTPSGKLEVDGDNYLNATTTTMFITDHGNNYNNGDEAVRLQFRSRYWSGDNNTGATNSSIIHYKGQSNGYGGSALGFTTSAINGVQYERMRITSDGFVGIGTTSPATKVHIVGVNGAVTPSSFSVFDLTVADNAEAAIGILGSTYSSIYLGDAANPNQGGIVYNHTSDSMDFRTNGNVEKMRITSGGEIQATPSASGRAFFSSQASANYSIAYTAWMANASTKVLDVLWYGSTIGSISVNASGTGVNYNTSSDYRLKENVVEMTGALDRVSQLKPSRFNFIADADKTVDGFLAHEVQDIVPEAITGTKDEVDEEGNAIYQGIDQSKLVPLLVGAIKELKAEIETLKTQING